METNKKSLKSKVGEKKVPSVFKFSASEPRYGHFVTQNEDFRKNKVILQFLKTTIYEMSDMKTQKPASQIVRTDNTVGSRRRQLTISEHHYCGESFHPG